MWCEQKGAPLPGSDVRLLQSHPKLVDHGRAAPNGLVVALLAAQLRMNRAFMEYMRKHENDYEPGK